VLTWDPVTAGGFEHVVFPSSDGTPIQGLAGSPDRHRPVPAVVHCHGGPTSSASTPTKCSSPPRWATADSPHPSLPARALDYFNYDFGSYRVVDVTGDRRAEILTIQAVGPIRLVSSSPAGDGTYRPPVAAGAGFADGEVSQLHDNPTQAAAALGQNEAELLAAKAAVESAELNLGYVHVTAPISGRIGKALVTEGALLSATEATQLAMIRQLDPVYFDLTQSSTEVLRLKRALMIFWRKQPRNKN